MSTNHTPNYQLSQWEPGDQVLRADFNADNAKIDGALKAQADALAAHGEVLAGLSNCRFYLTSYTGNGVCDLEHSPRIPLPGVPNLLVIFGGPYLAIHIPEAGTLTHIIVSGARTALFFGLSWDGSTAVLEQYTTNESELMNRNQKYYVIAVYPA